jgi:hypothetical protein
MPSLLLAFSDRLYRALLQAFPAAFRERFAAEMAQVYRSLCREAYAQSGTGGVLRLWLPVLWDGVRAALHQWYSGLLKQRTWMMQAKTIDREDNIQPLTITQAVVAVLPFLAFGLSNIWEKSGFNVTYPTDPPLWQILLTHPYLVFNWLVLIGLAIGLLAGFPRWAFSYLGWAILFGWWWSDMGFYGYHMGAEIWLPFLGVFLLTLLIRRSWQPLRNLFARLWGEWTLFSFGIYILYAHIFILYDENHHPNLLLFIAATALATCLGAWGYFRSASPLRRVLALVGGLVLAAVLSGISYATWDYRAYYGFPGGGSDDDLVMLIYITVLALIMGANGLLARWRLNRASRLKES